jgi:hypothetical protein
MRRDSAVAQSGSAGVGWRKELTSGAHASARGERDGAENRWWYSAESHQLCSFQNAVDPDVEAPTVTPILRGGPGTGYTTRLYLPPGHIWDA